MIFRDATEADFPLIADSFWRAAIEVDSCHGTGRLFLVTMLERVIRNVHWKIAIACDEGTPDEILCWAIWRNRAEIFWVCTPYKYRIAGLHLGRKMFEHIGVKDGQTVSCCIIPKDVYQFASRHRIKLLHRPYLALT
jgi:hypothetical protein